MIGIIIRREYLTRVRRRAFLLGTLLGPLILAAVMGAAVWMGVESEKPIKARVADRGGAGDALGFCAPSVGAQLSRLCS